MKCKQPLFLIPIFLLITIFLSCGEDDKNPVNGGNGTLTHSGGMVLIKAKDMTFQMGSNNGSIDEQPVHTVSFTFSFWMDTTEVTQADYDSLMNATYDGYFTPSWQVTFGQGDDYPAYAVYWDDAVLYCNARSKSEGLDTVYTYTGINGVPGSLCTLDSLSADLSKNGYRLPTEAEWEYACRAGSTSDFYWGEDYDPYPSTPEDSAEVNSFAVWSANSWIFGVGHSDYGTHPVGTKAPNSFGLYDMSGNVYEWCHDWYGDYDGSSQTDPTGPPNGGWHSVRGGSWGTGAGLLRSANRTFTSPDYQYYFLGFRCVKKQ